MHAGVEVLLLTEQADVTRMRDVARGAAVIRFPARVISAPN
jgi:hypothetical protein